MEARHSQPRSAAGWARPCRQPTQAGTIRACVRGGDGSAAQAGRTGGGAASIPSGAGRFARAPRGVRPFTGTLPRQARHLRDRTPAAR